MNELKLHWLFFKSTFTTSFVFSLILSLMIYPLFLTVFPIALMTGGPVVGLFFKDLFRGDEYYFFYNRGISKGKLISISWIIHIVFGLVVLIIFKWITFLK